MTLISRHLGFVVAGALALLTAACQAPPPAEAPTAQAATADRCHGARDDATVARAIGRDQARLDALHQMNIDNERLCIMPGRTFAQALRKSGDTAAKATKAARIDGYFKWWTAISRSRNGQADATGLIKALPRREADLRRARDAGILGANWTALGPNNIPGRVRAVVFHPTDPNKIWFGGVDGGVFRTTNGGASWTAASAFSGNIAVTSLVIDPAGPNTLYAATGEGFGNNDAISGAGVFMSQDGGASWSQLPATNPALNADWRFVNRLAIQPGNPSTLLAATGRGGIYRSADAGQSWTQVLALPANARNAYQVLFDPNIPTNAVAAFGGGIVAYSRDGGTTWTETAVTAQTQGSGRIELAYAKATPGLMLAGVEKESGMVFGSLDGGQTWTEIAHPRQFNAGAGDQGWYDNTIWIDPTNSANVVIGGINLFRATNVVSAAGALNTATSFTAISEWSLWPQSAHADNHSITAVPTYNGTTDRRVVVSNDGGLWLAGDILTVTAQANGGWRSINQGISTFQLFQASGVVQAPYLPPGGALYAGGAQDNGVAAVQAPGLTWTQIAGGDGGMTAIDATARTPIVYSEYVQGGVQRNSGGTLGTYVELCGNLTEGYCVNLDNANWVAPLYLDPTNAGRLVLGMQSLWYTNNPQAPTSADVVWHQIASPAANGDLISAVAMTPLRPGYVVIGTNAGGVWALNDAFSGGDAHWTQLVAPAATGGGSVTTSIVIDPDRVDTLYVTFGGFDQTGNLQMSADGGANWRDLSGALPQVPLFGIARHPSHPQWLYAGTVIGIYTSIDGGSSWNTTDDGPGAIAVTSVSFIPGTTALLAGTHGRGLFVQQTGLDPAQTPATGVYTDNASGGRRFLFERSGAGNAYLGLLAWADNGTPTWVSGLNIMPVGNTIISVPLSRYAGGPAGIVARDAGIGMLSFTGRSTGAWTWYGARTPIEQPSFGSGTQAAGTPQSGWWTYATGNAGSGLFIQIQGQTLLAYLLTFDTTGQPVWYQTQGQMSAATLYDGTLYLCRGGPTMTGAGGGQPACAGQGEVSLNFLSQNTARLSVGGSSAVVTRFGF